MFYQHQGPVWSRAVPPLISLLPHVPTFYTIFVCQMQLDYLITLVSVCVSVHRLVVERLRPQLFTDFYEILHAAQKCGCFERYCFWNKPEVVYRF